MTATDAKQDALDILPYEIWYHIIIMTGDIPTCGQVCASWRVMSKEALWCRARDSVAMFVYRQPYHHMAETLLRGSITHYIDDLELLHAPGEQWWKAFLNHWMSNAFNDTDRDETLCFMYHALRKQIKLA